MKDGGKARSPRDPGERAGQEADGQVASSPSGPGAGTASLPATPRVPARPQQPATPPSRPRPGAPVRPQQPRGGLTAVLLIRAVPAVGPPVTPRVGLLHAAAVLTLEGECPTGHPWDRGGAGRARGWDP